MRSQRHPPLPLRRVAALLACAATTGVVAACGGSSHHHSAQKHTPTIAGKPSVAPAVRGLPKSAVQRFASDRSAPPANHDDVQSGGKVVASSGFNPARDGFSFQNYGFIAGTQLTPAVLQQMFGSSACAHGSGSSCQLYPAVASWATLAEQGMAAGHCYGFSMTALRFFSHNLNPGAYGAGTPYGLQFTPAIESEIAANFAEQATAGPIAATQPEQPAQIIQSLISALNSHHGPYYTLGIFSGPVGSQGRDGHAITPIGISDLGNGQYQILVYDNNYPGATRAVNVDTNSETWSYVTQTDPSSGKGITWSGQHSTNEMFLIPVSAVERPQSFTTATRANEGVDTVALAGDPDRHAHLLLTLPDGRKLGYDHGRFVDQIRGAHVIYPMLNQVGVADPEPIYQVPGNPKLSVTLAGGNPTGTAAAQVLVVGPGFGAAVSSLQPSTSSGAEIEVAPSGSNVSVKLTGAVAGQAPTLKLARDHGRGGSTVTVASKSLATGNRLTIGLQPSSRTVSVAGSQTTAPVAVKLSSVTAGGIKTVKRAGVKVGANPTTLSPNLLGIG